MQAILAESFWFVAIMKVSTSGVAAHYVDEEVSVGDFVLSGGEIPALAILDATARLLPGVLKRRVLGC